MTTDGGQGAWERFADKVAAIVAHPGFFAFCVALVVLWVPSYLVMPKQTPGKVDTWQLVINTATTIITFLLVSLLHATQHRFEKATNERLHTLEVAIVGEDTADDEGQRPDRGST